MNPTRITVHCSDSPNGKYVSVDTIREWHLARGFSDIGYHFVIQPDGTLEHGRPFHENGAHVAGANDCNTGICLIGTDRFTNCQFETLIKLISGICKDYNIPNDQIYCHYQFPSAQAQGKTCPNFKRVALMELYEKKNWDALKPNIMG